MFIVPFFFCCVGDQPLLRVRVRGKSLNKVTIGQIKVIPEVSIYPISSRFFTGARLSKEAPFLLFQAFYTPHLHLLSTTAQSGRTFRTRVSVNFVYFILQFPFYFVDGGEVDLPRSGQAKNLSKCQYL
jgi:hypothetical protein